MTWVTDGSFPDKNIKVIAFLDGHSFHSGWKWRRCGFEFMVHHPSEENGWSAFYYDKALESIDADELRVIRWMYIPEKED